MMDPIFGDTMMPAQRLEKHLQLHAGVKHARRVVPRAPRPGESIQLTLVTSGALPFERAVCLYQTAAQKTETLELARTRVTWDAGVGDYLTYWTGTLPPQANETMVRYRIAAHVAGTGEEIFADNASTRMADATEFAMYVTDRVAPAWARDALVYHIFVDRFYPGDGVAWKQPDSLGGFFGGTLRGIIQKLDYVAELGFNAIWLSPLFVSPSHHGYDAADYYTVEPRLGTNADLVELFERAHARGMRVLLDFVANHWSHLHATFQDAQTDPHSPYRDWYTWREYPHSYETYFDVPTLPQVNVRHPDARNYLLDSAAYWLKQGADGFRLDYATGPSDDFWADFYRACKTTKADAWLFGEIIASPSAQARYEGIMDGVLDFHLGRALRQTFGSGEWTLAQFEAFLAAHEKFFPPALMRPVFLDNHDQDRFLFLAGDNAEKLELAALVLFALAQPGIVYNGTEVGVTQTQLIHSNNRAVFEEARRPMKWGAEQNADLYDAFRKLIRLRKQYPALAYGTRRLLHLNSAGGTYAFAREWNDSTVVVAVNTSDSDKTISVPRWTTTARDVLNAQRVNASAGQLEIVLHAHSGALLV